MKDRADDVAISKSRIELAMFLFLAILFWPLLAVAAIGSYGFAVWMSDVLFGPPPLL
jgi:nitrate reductase NapE